MSSRVRAVKWTLRLDSDGVWKWFDANGTAQKVSSALTTTYQTRFGGQYTTSYFRMWNDSSAIMDFIPNFLTTQQQNDLVAYLEQLQQAGEFETDAPFVFGRRRDTGRLVKDFGDGQFRYSGQTIAAAGWGRLAALRDYVSLATGAPYNYAHVVMYNYTETQRAKNPAFLLGLHKDSEAVNVPGSKIAAVSLVSVATFTMLRDQKLPSGASLYLDAPLPKGSLFVMGGNMQGRGGWKHAVRRIPAAGKRISITFRQHRTSGADAGMQGDDEIDYDI